MIDEDHNSRICEERDPKLGDYARKRSRSHYIGTIVIGKDKNGDYKVKFLHKSKQHTTCALIAREQEEIRAVEDWMLSHPGKTITI